jgi:HSP20 family molecular chaperone IbpA
MGNPLRWFVELMREIDRGLGEMRNLSSLQGTGEDFVTGRVWEPEAEVLYGENGKVALRVELPDVEPSGVDVGARAASVVTVSGIGNRGTFFRQLVLPYEVYGGKARAEIGDGVLWVGTRETGEGYPHRVPVETIHDQGG